MKINKIVYSGFLMMMIAGGVAAAQTVTPPVTTSASKDLQKKEKSLCFQLHNL